MDETEYGSNYLPIGWLALDDCLGKMARRLLRNILFEAMESMALISRLIHVLRRLAIVDQLFAIAWTGTLITVFELFFEMYKAGLIKHPIWSEIWGWPIPHHFYWFHISILIIWNIARRWEI